MTILRAPGSRITPAKAEHGDYIVYVDESGDHSLESIDSTYPVFVLAFCIFEKRSYIEKTVPAMQALKFKFFGHDMVVFHESDIRKSRGDFAFLINAELRQAFLSEMSTIIDEAAFTVIALAIKKETLKARFSMTRHPYNVAMKFGLERVTKFLDRKGQSEKTTHVVVERRGKKEDGELELEFLRICGGKNYRQQSLPLKLTFADKRVNSCGLQLADLVARPIGRHVLEPSQDNRAYTILERKLDRSAAGTIHGYGLKVYP